MIEGATPLHSGKVRDLYRLPSGDLLMVASDRISAFDFVLDTTIPDKGSILTRCPCGGSSSSRTWCPTTSCPPTCPTPSGVGPSCARASTCTPWSAWRVATSRAPG